MRQRVTITSATLLALTSSGSVAAFEMPSVDIHGFVSQSFIYSTDNNWFGNSESGSWKNTETAVNFSSELTDDLRVGAQIFARQLGDLGDMEPTIDWAYADWRWRDELGIRFGRYKLPIGLYNEVQDIDAVRPNALLPQSVYNAGYRDTVVGANGIQAYGIIEAGGAGSFDYQAYIGSMTMDEDGSVAKAFESGSNPPIDVTDFDIDYTAGGQLMYNTPLEGLRTGISIYTINEWDTFGHADVSLNFPGVPVPVTTEVPFHYHTDRYLSMTYSTEYQWDQWTFAAEYQRNSALFENMSGGSDIDYDVEGWYLQWAYNYDEFWTFSGYFARWDGDRDNDSTPPDNGRTGYQNNWVGTVRYDVNYNWNIKAEVHLIDGNNLVSASDNPSSSDPTGYEYEEDWAMFVLKTTATF